MKVKMLISITGTIDGQPWPEKGGVIDVPQVVADDLISNQYAEPVAGSKAPKVEAASVDPVEETASISSAKPRKKTADD